MMDWHTYKGWLTLQPISGQRTQALVATAFILNFVCYLSLPEASTNLWKMLVQQTLILCIGTMGAKLDRLRPK